MKAPVRGSAKHLRELLHEAGFERCVAGATVLTSGTEDEAREFGRSQADFFGNRVFIARATERGWSNAAEMADIGAWAKNPAAFVARFNCHAIAWTPS